MGDPYGFRRDLQRQRRYITFSHLHIYTRAQPQWKIGWVKTPSTHDKSHS